MDEKYTGFVLWFRVPVKVGLHESMLIQSAIVMHQAAEKPLQHSSIEKHTTDLEHNACSIIIYLVLFWKRMVNI